MLKSDSLAAPSVAAIRSHPIHPMIVPFPIAFLVGTAAVDIAYWWSGNPFWIEVSFWSLSAGILMGLLAGVAGLIDFIKIEKVRSKAAGWVHAIGNSAVLVLAALNYWIRSDDDGRVLPAGLALSLVVALILMITGWLGGELSYRYRIGVMADDIRSRREA